MLIFIDLDGTLFDTASLNPRSVKDWMLAYANAPVIEDAQKVVSNLAKDGHFLLGITARGLMLGREEYDISGLVLKENFGKDINGLVWKIEDKGKWISNNLKQINNVLNKNYDPSEVLLIDDDIEQVIGGVARGFNSILFGVKEDVKTNELPHNIKVAKNWKEVNSLIPVSNLTQTRC